MICVSRNASSSASGPCSWPKYSSRAHDRRRGFEREAEHREKLRIPVAGLQIHQPGVAGVGVLRHAAPAQPVENVLRHHRPRRVRSRCRRCRIRQQLVHRVDAMRMCACALIELERRNDPVRGFLVATRFARRDSRMARAAGCHPAPDAHSPPTSCRRRSKQCLRAPRRSLAQTFFKPGENLRQRPAHRICRDAPAHWECDE